MVTEAYDTLELVPLLVTDEVGVVMALDDGVETLEDDEGVLALLGVVDAWLDAVERVGEGDVEVGVGVTWADPVRPQPAIKKTEPGMSAKSATLDMGSTSLNVHYNVW